MTKSKISANILESCAKGPGDLRDFLANKFLPETASPDPAVSAAAMALWKRIFPEHIEDAIKRDREKSLRAA